MRAPRHRDLVSPRIPASRAAALAGTRQWDDVQNAVEPALGASPAAIRALRFAAALGPQQPPFTADDGAVDDRMIDLAGEEALIAYLASLAPANA